MYTVVRAFKDRDGRCYEVGDSYPHTEAKALTKKRTVELAQGKNKYGKVYIEKVGDE